MKQQVLQKIPAKLTVVRDVLDLSASDNIILPSIPILLPVLSDGYFITDIIDCIE
jgi:hypothetical protein